MKHNTAFFRTLIVASAFVSCKATQNKDPRIDSLQARLDSITQYQRTQELPSKSADTKQSATVDPSSVNGDTQAASTSRASVSRKDEEISQWKKFRDDEDKYKGEKLKWRIKLRSVPGGTWDESYAWAWLENDMQFKCDLWDFVPNADKPFARLHGDDWVEVEGTFLGVSKDGEVSIYGTKITKAIRPSDDNY